MVGVVCSDLDLSIGTNSSWRPSQLWGGKEIDWTCGNVMGRARGARITAGRIIFVLSNHGGQQAAAMTNEEPLVEMMGR